jgi:hypothetical protein
VTHLLFVSGYISNGQICVCDYTASFKWSSDAQFHLDSHIPPNGFSILHVNIFEFTLLISVHVFRWQGEKTLELESAIK